MTLGQKLKTLLKEKNMTQEELAEQLDVSRQAVGKWVNDKGIPEVGKLIQISNMFGVTLDYLLKEEAKEGVSPEGGYYVSGEMLEGYLAYQKQNRKRIVGGISLIMLANIADEWADGAFFGMADGIYWIITLAGLAVLIWQCFQTRKYREIKQEKLLFDNKVYETFKQRYENERKKCALLMIAGLAFLMVGSDILTFLTGHIRFLADSLNILEWISDTAGVAFILWASLTSSAEGAVIKNMEEGPKKGTGRFKWVYWAAPVTVMAVVIGFFTNIWSPMAPVIVLLCALLITVCKLLLEERNHKG